MTKIQKLGQIVRTTRKEQGLTQEQLAAVSGVGVRFVRDTSEVKNPAI
jgi:transcriptional regulator with XRE-family HTH domain